MNDSLYELISFAAETHDHVIVHERETQQNIVIVPFDKYKQLVQNKADTMHHHGIQHEWHEVASDGEAGGEQPFLKDPQPTQVEYQEVPHMEEVRQAYHSEPEELVYTRVPGQPTPIESTSPKAIPHVSEGGTSFEEEDTDEMVFFEEPVS